MRFNCGLTKEEKEKAEKEAACLKKLRQEVWHDYFCWWPTRIGYRDCCWLETVQRKIVVKSIMSYSIYGPLLREEIKTVVYRQKP